MTDQLPATVLPGTLALTADIRLVPGLIADLGEQAPGSQAKPWAKPWAEETGAGHVHVLRHL